MPITPRQLDAALGEHAIGDMMEQTGMERDELIETLRYLPRVIDHLTPDGRIPIEQEVPQWGDLFQSGPQVTPIILNASSNP